MTGRLRIAFQGEPGANGDEACRAYFPDHEPAPHAAFEDAFDAVRRGDCTLALIPVENSIAGRVADVHHLLPSSGLKIIGERFKPIRFQLMANPGVKLEDVKTVTSMPIALGQCRRALRRLGVRTEPSGDTAGAAKALSERPDPTRAAIAPALAARLYGLTILLADVEDETHNTTRFLVMSAEADPSAPPKGAPCITSFTFRVRNIPAALYKALGGFAT
ncbi:MAG TPA: prephenate dehydratase domain-containing protein, partial [Caulobacteraceae bacterium]